MKTWDPRGRGRLEQSCETTYLTLDTTDDALAHARSARGPWFLHVNYNATHLPMEAPPPYLSPPTALCGPSKTNSSDAPRAPLADLVLEALDTELMRLIAGLRAVDPDVIVVVTSDNGSDHRAATGRRDSCFGPNRSKGTLFEGGVRVPLLVVGNGVVPGECTALVSLTDLFATFGELAGVPARAEDSISLVPYLRGERTPLRSFVYAEYYRPNFTPTEDSNSPDSEPFEHRRMVSDGRFKLVRYTSASGIEVERLYDLRDDPCERRSLHEGPSPVDPTELPPPVGARYLALQAELVRLGVY